MLGTRDVAQIVEYLPRMVQFSVLCKLDMDVHICNSSVWEVGAGESDVHGHLQLQEVHGTAWARSLVSDKSIKPKAQYWVIFTCRKSQTQLESN